MSVVERARIVRVPDRGPARARPRRAPRDARAPRPASAGAARRPGGRSIARLRTRAAGRADPHAARGRRSGGARSTAHRRSAARSAPRGGARRRRRGTAAAAAAPGERRSHRPARRPVRRPQLAAQARRHRPRDAAVRGPRRVAGQQRLSRARSRSTRSTSPPDTVITNQLKDVERDPLPRARRTPAACRREDFRATVDLTDGRARPGTPVTLPVDREPRSIPRVTILDYRPRSDPGRPGRVHQHRPSRSASTAATSRRASRSARRVFAPPRSP